MDKEEDTCTDERKEATGRGDAERDDATGRYGGA